MGEFLDPEQEIAKHGSKLPHWQQGKVMQFVTFRLGDSMPQGKLRQWRVDRKVWLAGHPQPWSRETERDYHRRFSRQLETWLDEGHGSCLLRDPEPRAILEDCLRFDEGTRVEHHAWVIMPNHLHLLFTPRAALDQLIRNWKGISARRIGHGSIWQKNYRDTLVRDAGHFANAVRYIRRNPTTLPAGTFSLWQSSRARKVQGGGTIPSPTRGALPAR